LQTGISQNAPSHPELHWHSRAFSQNPFWQPGNFTHSSQNCPSHPISQAQKLGAIHAPFIHEVPFIFSQTGSEQGLNRLFLAGSLYPEKQMIFPFESQKYVEAL